MKIELLGTGCANCRLLEENVRRALLELNNETDIEKVTDMAAIVGFGVMALPALAINGKLVWQGKVGPIKELIYLIQDYVDGRD